MGSFWLLKACSWHCGVARVDDVRRLGDQQVQAGSQKRVGRTEAGCKWGAPWALGGHGPLRGLYFQKTLRVSS